jgi:signal transduction histidine kinase
MNLSRTPSRSRQKRIAHLPPQNQIDSSFKTMRTTIGIFDKVPDVLERVRLEQQLLASQRRVQELEKDRDRITCDLHDGVLQSLYAMGLGLESCGLLLRDAPAQVTEQLQRSTAQLDQALRELRSFLKHDLGNEIGGEEDFDRALHALVEGATGMSSTHGRLTIDHAAIEAIPKGQHRNLLHFAREALSNCIRHAQAATVEVTLTLKNGILCLGISDDGIGFIPHNPPKRGLGLQSLAARAAALGGRVRIVSAPAQGTRIALELPGT